MTEDRIAKLESLIADQWWVFCNCYLQDMPPDEIKRSRAFRAMDERVRALGIPGFDQVKP